MSVLSLQNSIIYGPVRSRRLGASLGVNLLPRARKFCSFDCVYCQYGWTERHALEVSERKDLPTLDEVRRMCSQMLEAERQWLPQFGARSLRQAPAIFIPPDVSPVEVPLDPALAIANRFGELAEREVAPQQA